MLDCAYSHLILSPRSILLLCTVRCIETPTCLYNLRIWGPNKYKKTSQCTVANNNMCGWRLFKTNEKTHSRDNRFIIALKIVQISNGERLWAGTDVSVLFYGGGSWTASSASACFLNFAPVNDPENDLTPPVPQNKLATFNTCFCVCHHASGISPKPNDCPSFVQMHAKVQPYKTYRWETR